MLLPERGARWRAESENFIVASIAVPPEQPELELRIDEGGAVRTVSLLRWGNVGQQDFGYIPFGGDVEAERRFGDPLLPSRLTVGWCSGLRASRRSSRRSCSVPNPSVDARPVINVE